MSTKATRPTRRQLEVAVRAAFCLLASTIFTGNRILTEKQRNARRRLLRSAERLLPSKKKARS